MFTVLSYQKENSQSRKDLETNKRDVSLRKRVISLNLYIRAFKARNLCIIISHDNETLDE